MLVLSQPLLLLRTDIELTLVLGLMTLILFAAIILFIVANRIGKVQRQLDAEKRCPYCAESIKKDAIVCRFCGRDLPVPEPKQQPEAIEKIETPQVQSNPILEPVLQTPVIQEPVTQQLSATVQEPKIQPQKQTSGQNKKGLAVVVVILIMCLVFGVLSQSFSKSSSTSNSSSPSSYSSSSSSSSSSSASSSSSSGNTVSLYIDGTEILCGRTEQDFKDLIAALVREDDYGFKELFLLDRAFIVDSRTKALVLDLNFSNGKVRILEGTHENEICYTAIEAIGK